MHNQNARIKAHAR